MGPAAFDARHRSFDGDDGLLQKVLELQRFCKIAVPDQRAVGNADVR
jgi:hypothetical protein